METFKASLARCRLGRARPKKGEEFIEGKDAHNEKHGYDDAGRDMRCAICRDELCVCGNPYDCEHDVDQRHGWAPLDFEYFEDGTKRPWRCGTGPWVIRDAEDGRYIGREPDGATPAIRRWPTKLNRHVMHFPTREAAVEYITKSGDPVTKAPRYLRVRPIAKGGQHV